MARLSGDLVVDEGTIEDRHISPTTDVDCDKLQQYIPLTCNFDIAIGDAPTDQERIVHVAGSNGTIRSFRALMNVTGSASSVDFDLKVNGTSVLSSAVTITNATADRDPQDGTISSASYSADDVISIECDQTTTTGAQGPAAQVILEENTLAV